MIKGKVSVNRIQSFAGGHEREITFDIEGLNLAELRMVGTALALFLVRFEEESSRKETGIKKLFDQIPETKMREILNEINLTAVANTPDSQ